MMRASGCFRCRMNTYFETTWTLSIAGTCGDGGDAARQRRVEHLLDRVVDVVRRDLLAVVELDALLQRPADRRLADDLELLGERRLDVQVAGPTRRASRRRTPWPSGSPSGSRRTAPRARGPTRAPRRACRPVLIGVARVPLGRGFRRAGERARRNGACADRTRLLQQLSTVELAPRPGCRTLFRLTSCLPPPIPRGRQRI